MWSSYKVSQIPLNGHSTRTTIPLNGAFSDSLACGSGDRSIRERLARHDVELKKSHVPMLDLKE
jgi:hypothetical protein